MTNPTALDQAVDAANRLHGSPPARPTIALCGSLTRAPHDLNRLAWHLKAAGYRVHAPTPKPADVDQPTGAQLAHLTAGHYADILDSHLTIAVATDGIIGDATDGEMRHARKNGVPTRWVLSEANLLGLLADIAAGRLLDTVEVVR